MKKNLLVILIVLLMILGGYLYYAWKHGGELLFDMKAVLGETTNNSYGIRNDVYDWFQQEMKKSNIQELNEPRVYNLFLNFMKSEQLMMKHFSDKNLTIEIIFKKITIMGCFFLLERTDEKKYGALNVFFEETVIGSDRRKSPYNQVFLNTEDRQTIRKIASYYMNGKTLNPRERSPYYHPNLCDKLFDEVLSDEEFFDNKLLIKLGDQ